MSTTLSESPRPEQYEDAPIFHHANPYAELPELFTPEDFQQVQECIQYFKDLREVQYSKPDEITPGVHERIISYQSKKELTSYEIIHMTEVANALRLFGERIGAEIFDALPMDEKLTDGAMYRSSHESYEGLKPFARQAEYYALRFMFEYSQLTQTAFHTVLIDAIYNQEVARAMGKPTISQIGSEIVSEVHEMYQRDIPAYQYVYDSFDQMRAEGDKPFEIYLGRDGVYAFHGRRGQVASRKSLLDPAERVRLKELGELDELYPKYKYFVFNRPMHYAASEVHGDINAAQNRRVLQHYIKQAISPEDNPHFYDTGYVGSIPVAIMHLMGFSKDEIDKRIHLLSSGFKHRKVRQLPEDFQINIELIETNEKDEASAVGVTQLDTGELEHVAQPTSIYEQLHFIVARDTLLRHFWIAERKKSRLRPDLQAIARDEQQE